MKVDSWTEDYECHSSSPFEKWVDRITMIALAVIVGLLVFNAISPAKAELSLDVCEAMANQVELLEEIVGVDIDVDNHEPWATMQSECVSEFHYSIG